MNPWAAIIGAGLGLGKSELIDKPNENRQRKYAAETIRLSPWTGMSKERAAAGVHEADPFGSTLQGGLAGASFGQSMDAAGGMDGMFGGEAAMPGSTPMEAPIVQPQEPGPVSQTAQNPFGVWNQMNRTTRGYYPQPSPKAYG